MSPSPDAPARPIRLHELPRPLAFVFSGGGGAGATQVGMIRALHEHGVEPDLVVGSSVGALNGVLLAEQGGTATETLTSLWTSMRRRTLFGPPHRTMLNLARHRHVGSVDHLRNLITANLAARRFDELACRFIAVATDAGTGAAVSLTDGDLISALLASTALPGVFPGHDHDGRLYLDGGASANLPIRQAVAAGAASVVALDAVSAPSDDHRPKAGPRSLIAATRIMLRSQAAHDPTMLDRPVVILPPATPPDVGAFDFRRTGELIELGYTLTASFLADEHEPATRARPSGR